MQIAVKGVRLRHAEQTVIGNGRHGGTTGARKMPRHLDGIRVRRVHHGIKGRNKAGNLRCREPTAPQPKRRLIGSRQRGDVRQKRFRAVFGGDTCRNRVAASKGAAHKVAPLGRARKDKQVHAHTCRITSKSRRCSR